MKATVVQRLIALGALLLAGLPLRAEPLKLSQLPANPDWLIHLDLDQLKQTKLGEFILAKLEKPEVVNKLDAFRTIFNFDPRRNIRGLTLYGEGTTPADAILLVLGQFDSSRLVTLAKGAEAYQSSTHRDYTIHSWVDKNLPSRLRGNPRTYGAIHSSGVVIFGQKETRVAQALDVLDQLQPNLQGKEFAADLVVPGNNNFLVGATKRLPLSPSNPNAAMLKRARSVSLALRQKDQDLMADLSLQAEDNETAQQILAVGQGLSALLSLQTDNPQAATLARAMTFSQKGEKVRLTLKLPVNQVVEMLEKKTKH